MKKIIKYVAIWFGVTVFLLLTLIVIVGTGGFFNRRDPSGNKYSEDFSKIFITKLKDTEYETENIRDFSKKENEYYIEYSSYIYSKNTGKKIGKITFRDQKNSRYNGETRFYVMEFEGMPNIEIATILLKMIKATDKEIRIALYQLGYDIGIPDERSPQLAIATRGKSENKIHEAYEKGREELKNTKITKDELISGNFIFKICGLTYYAQEIKGEEFHSLSINPNKKYGIIEFIKYLLQIKKLK